MEKINLCKNGDSLMTVSAVVTKNVEHKTHTAMLLRMNTTQEEKTCLSLHTIVFHLQNIAEVFVQTCNGNPAREPKT